MALALTSFPELRFMDALLRVRLLNRLHPCRYIKSLNEHLCLVLPSSSVRWLIDLFSFIVESQMQMLGELDVQSTRLALLGWRLGA